MYQRVVRGALVSSPRFRPSKLHRVVLAARGASSPLPSSAMWTSAAAAACRCAMLLSRTTATRTTATQSTGHCCRDDSHRYRPQRQRRACSRCGRRLPTGRTGGASSVCSSLFRTGCASSVFARDLCLCGTHSGVVALSDLESGILLQRWLAPAPGGGSEVTSVGFDGEHIISGDASGGVCLRWWRPTTSLSPPPRSLPRPLCGQHRGAVSGVHWPGGDVACSCPADACPAWEPRRGPGAAAR